jgi:translation initiation factor 2 beta subunit (eIF-2beta)/eIF-5
MVAKVKEVEEVEETKTILRRSFLLTCLALIAVYSAAATETNP